MWLPSDITGEIDYCGMRYSCKVVEEAAKAPAAEVVARVMSKIPLESPKRNVCDLDKENEMKEALVQLQ